MVSYAAAVKHDLLGVPEGPVVTEAAARAMAVGVRALLGSDVAVAATGVAGPAEQEGRPPGTVCLAVALGDPDAGTVVDSMEVQLPGRRTQVRRVHGDLPARPAPAAPVGLGRLMPGPRGAGALRHGLSVPLFGDLAEPAAMLELARLADDRGWDGIFPWDHVLADGPRPVADVWVVLAAVATVTERVLLGPMVTPLPRRRPQKLAREVVTLDRLSGGRVVLGLGLGVDHARELSAFGEVVDARERGADARRGPGGAGRPVGRGEVLHRGPHYTADGVRFLPTAARPGGVPIWMAARTMAEAPLRRAAGRDGLFVIERTPEEVASMLGVVAGVRGGLEGFALPPWPPARTPHRSCPPGSPGG